MNLNRLRVFRVVYERSSVSEAARALNLTQPPVTRMLRAYEEDIGFKLFNRERGRLVPTPEADYLYNEVVTMFDDLEQLERTSADLREGRRDRLAFAAAMALGFTLLGPVVKRFRQRYPNIPIHAHAGTMQDQVNALQRGDIDFSLSYGGQTSPEIKSEIVGDGAFVVLLPDDHPLTRKASIKLADLAGCTLLSGPKGLPLRLSVESELEAAELDVSRDLLSYTPVLVASWVSAGLGIGIVDQFAAAMLPHPNLAVRPLTPTIHFQLQVLTTAQKRLSMPQEYFVEEIATEIRGSKPPELMVL